MKSGSYLIYQRKGGEGCTYRDLLRTEIAPKFQKAFERRFISLRDGRGVFEPLGRKGDLASFWNWLLLVY